MKMKLEDWLCGDVSVDSSVLELGFRKSEKSSTKTNSMTGVHCPGNKEVFEPKPDISEIRNHCDSRFHKFY